MNLTHKLKLFGVAAAATALLASGCGAGDDDAGDDAGDNGDNGDAADGEPGELVDVEVGDDCAVSASSGTDVEPEVTVPDCDPPTELIAEPLVESDGMQAGMGDTVSVQYAGYSWSDGEKFDASWDNNATPFDVESLGNAEVIEGWNEGLLGAYEDERRVLVIPPEQGYGDEGTGPIAGGETLVFVVDVLSVTPVGE